jgi:hypothetical protein
MLAVVAVGLAAPAATVSSASAAPPAMLVRPSASHASSQAAAWCHGSQAWQTLRASVGVLVRVKARIAHVTYASATAGRPTFIDPGHAYPNANRLSLVIWGENRVNFPRAPERMFRPDRSSVLKGSRPSTEACHSCRSVFGTQNRVC